MAKTTEVEEKTQRTEVRRKALETAQDEIEKRFGKGSLMRLSADAVVNVEVIPSGSIRLDKALGVWGYPRGRIVEIYGPESAGKTTLALHAVAEAQKLGGIAAFIDAEHALDMTYARNLGIKVDDLWMSQPDSGEQALEICETLVRSGAVDVIVIDSVAALVPEAEITGEMGDSHMGLQARLMSQAMRKLNGIVKNSNTLLIFVNQIRYKIGVVFGNPETQPGGRALKFYASVRVEVRKVETLSGSNKDEPDGNLVRAKIIKNKVAPPYRKAEFVITFGKGIDAVRSIVEAAVDAGVVDKAGSWYSYGDERLGQGIVNAVKTLEENEKLRSEIEEKVRNA